MSNTSFTFRTFKPTGEGNLTATIAGAILDTQTYLNTPRSSFQKCLMGDFPNWRLRLAIEDAAVLDLQFTRVSRPCAVAHILRGDRDALLIAIKDAASIEVGTFQALQEALGELSASPSLEGMLDWVSGCAPPLAGLAYLKGEADPGLELVGMCLADSFFFRVATSPRP